LGPQRCTFAGLGFRTAGCPKKGMFRKPVVGGNWKCNGTKKSVEELLTAFKGGRPDKNSVDVCIFPPAVHIHTAQKALAGCDSIQVGVQNISKDKEGAFTGEVTVAMAQDLNIPWVMVGHSERRSLFGETDADCAMKTAKALEKGLMVMFCIGEQLAERKAGTTLDVCTTQLMAVIPEVTDWSKMVIAYEPVWAIGTGVVATPLQAQETHFGIRQLIRDQCGSSVADNVRILYGGSVSPGNCKELGELPDVDGFLVGGASMKPTFNEVIASAAKLFAK